jgi:hypothetical protein
VIVSFYEGNFCGDDWIGDTTKINAAPFSTGISPRITPPLAAGGPRRKSAVRSLTY